MTKQDRINESLYNFATAGGLNPLPRDYLVDDLMETIREAVHVGWTVDGRPLTEDEMLGAAPAVIAMIDAELAE